MTLETFVAHKGGYGLPLDESGVDRLLEQFSGGGGEIACDGENDPRALPLHVFETSHDWRGLGVTAVNQQFVKLYGKARHRVDEGKKAWKRPAQGDFHGREIVTVAGRELVRGMHWDVSTPKRKDFLYGVDQIWQLAARNAHTNVYPDAHVRRGSYSTRVWKAKRAQD